MKSAARKGKSPQGARNKGQAQSGNSYRLRVAERVCKEWKIDGLDQVFQANPKLKPLRWRTAAVEALFKIAWYENSRKDAEKRIKKAVQIRVASEKGRDYEKVKETFRHRDGEVVFDMLIQEEVVSQSLSEDVDWRGEVEDILESMKQDSGPELVDTDMSDDDNSDYDDDESHDNEDDEDDESSEDDTAPTRSAYLKGRRASDERDNMEIDLSPAGSDMALEPMAEPVAPLVEQQLPMVRSESTGPLSFVNTLNANLREAQEELEAVTSRMENHVTSIAKLEAEIAKLISIIAQAELTENSLHELCLGISSPSAQYALCTTIMESGMRQFIDSSKEELRMKREEMAALESGQKELGDEQSKKRSVVEGAQQAVKSIEDAMEKLPIAWLGRT